jgi:hypothetical protein
MCLAQSRAMLTQTHVGWLMTGLLAALGAPLACGGSASQAEGSGGSSSLTSCTPSQQLSGGFEACEEGYLHRPSAGECALPPRVACDPAVDTDTTQCSSDANCSYAPNGRCNSVGGACLCDYPCIRDEDCGAGMICLCGDALATMGGRCAIATCRTDADCGGGLCASSTPGCGGGLTFACLTASDECHVDSDCDAGYICQANGGTRSCAPAGCGGIGRPFLVAGEERLACPARRADWARDDFESNVSALDEPVRRALALAWTRVGLMEHASIAAFARFALQLLSLGAPAELVERAHRAFADETRHARICFAFASAHAGEPVGPGALDVSQALNDGRFEHIVCTAILEGCVGETLAAAEAREAAANASDPRVAAALHAIAEDEAEHAALAWRFVAWAIDAADAEARAAIHRELARVASSAAPAVTDDAPLELARHGFVVGARRVELRAQVMAEVVAPCAHLVAARARKNIQIVSELVARV